MDVSGCRKTVFTGKFAIHRQMMSNSRPISLVRRNARRCDPGRTFMGAAKQLSEKGMRARGQGHPSRFCEAIWRPVGEKWQRRASMVRGAHPLDPKHWGTAKKVLIENFGGFRPCR